MDKHALIISTGKFLVVSADDKPDSIQEYTLVREKKHTYVGSNERYSDQEIMKEFCWPVQVRQQLVSILTVRTRLKKEWDDSMKLVYELNNKLARGEIER